MGILPCSIPWICPSQRSRYCWKRVIIHRSPERSAEDLGDHHEVRPFDGQNTPQVPHMEWVEYLFLPGVACHSLIAVAKGTEDSSSVDSHLSVDGQLMVFPDYIGQSCKSRGGSSDAPIYLSVQREVGLTLLTPNNLCKFVHDI